ERPQVVDRRRLGEEVLVAALGDDEPPVREVRHGRDDVAAEVAHDRGTADRRAVEHGEAGGEPGRGEQAAGPATPEPDEVDRAGAGPLVEEQRGDEEARQGEERRDAEEPPAGPAEPAVEDEHRDDEHRPEPVERGLVAERRLRGVEWQHQWGVDRSRMELSYRVPVAFILGVDLDGVCADYTEALRGVVATQRGIDPSDLADPVTWDFADWGLDRSGFERLHRS